MGCAQALDGSYERLAGAGIGPDITDVTVLARGVLRLTLADGREGDVEVLDRMRGPVFENARTEEGFAEVTVDAESGTIVWAGGADLAPERSMSASAPACGPAPSRLDSVRIDPWTPTIRSPANFEIELAALDADSLEHHAGNPDARVHIRIIRDSDADGSTA
jgi:hypothetical protein